MISGPVHTLQQEITPEMVVAIQHEYEVKDREMKQSNARHGIHFPRKHNHAEHAEP